MLESQAQWEKNERSVVGCSMEVTLQLNNFAESLRYEIISYFSHFSEIPELDKDLSYLYTLIQNIKNYRGIDKSEIFTYRTKSVSNH